MKSYFLFTFERKSPVIYSGLDLLFDMKIAVFVVGCPGGIGKLDYIAQKNQGKSM